MTDPRRTPRVVLAIALALAFSLAPATLRAADTLTSFVTPNDITWTTLGKNENDSMPLGNGDLAANVWTESNGDLVLLLAKATPGPSKATSSNSAASASNCPPILSPAPPTSPNPSSSNPPPSKSRAASTS